MSHFDFEYSIVTHEGKAHRDDFLSCCLLVAAFPVTRIYRRKPSKEEMESRNVFVVDVGMDYNPAKKNFDHHQLATIDSCALTLVLDYLIETYNIEVPMQDRGTSAARRAYVRKLLPWLEFTEIADCQGPDSAFAAIGLPNIDSWQQAKLSDPISTRILAGFGKVSDVTKSSLIMQFMSDIGKEMINNISGTAARMQLLDKSRKWEVAGHLILDTRHIPGTEDPSKCVDLWCKENRIKPDFVIANNDRSPGEISIIRKQGTFHLGNAAMLAGKREGRDYAFAHSNGFLISFLPGKDPLDFLMAVLKTESRPKDPVDELKELTVPAK